MSAVIALVVRTKYEVAERIWRRNSNASSVSQDNFSFGPQHKDDDDFTLNFEQNIFITLPSAVAIVASLIYVWQATRNGPCMRADRLFFAKTVVSLSLLGPELAALGLYISSPTRNTTTSVTASGLACTASILIAIVVGIAHRFSVRSSALVSIYLTLTAIFDAAKIRSYFARSDTHSLAYASIVAAVIKGILLILEEIPKRSSIANENVRNSVGNETVSGFWSRSFFVWLNELLFLGYRKDLTPDNLENLGPEFGSEHLYKTFALVWATGNKASRFCLLRSSIVSLFGSFLSIIPPRLLYSGFFFVKPLLLQRTIAFIGQSEHPKFQRNGLIGACVLLYVGEAISRSIYNRMRVRFSVQVRGVLTSHIHRKTLLLPQTTAAESASLSLMSTDVEEAVQGLTGFHDVWISLVEAIMAIYLLTSFVGAASIFGVVSVILTTICTAHTGRAIFQARLKWNAQTQTRVAKTSAALSQMKNYKMVGLGPVVNKYLQSLRAAEVVHFKQYRFIIAIQVLAVCLMDLTTPIAIVAGALFWTTWHGKLFAPDVYATLAACTLLTEPLMKLTRSYSEFSSTVACFSRIQAYLLLEEKQDPRSSVLEAVSAEGERTEKDSRQIREKSQQGEASTSCCRTEQVKFVNASIAPVAGKPTLLRDVSVSIEESTLVLVVGPSGSGKTTFARAVLGEAEIPAGDVYVKTGTFGYCSQTTWLENVSIRQNIIGQSPYDSVWFNKVVKACLLEEDLLQLAEGDQTLAGSGGSHLSGGQKQRVALARTTYLRPSMVVLDDVLSALDPRTAKAIFSNLLSPQGLFTQSGATVVLTTPSLKHLNAADLVITIDSEGKVISRKGVVESEIPPEFVAQLSSGTNGETERASGTVERQTEYGDTTATTSRKSGDLSLYRYYFHSTPKILLLAYPIIMLLGCAMETLPNIYLRIWLDVAPENTRYFIGYSLTSVVGSAVVVSIQLAYYQKVVPQSAEHLHQTLLDTVVGGTLHFLTSAEHGSILNKFSQDISLVTLDFALYLFRTFYLLGFTIIEVIFIASGSKYAVPIVPALIAAFYVLQRFYLRTSRQMRHMDLEAKTPLFVHFTETEAGLEHIRSYGWEEKRFARGLEIIDASQKPYYYMLAIQGWLILSLDITIAVVSSAVVSVALCNTESTSMAAFGLALLAINVLSRDLGDVIGAWTLLETALGAVGRIRSFSQETPSEKDMADATNMARLPTDWPQRGEIVLENVTARYSPSLDTPAAIDEVSLTIPSGKTVGVLGRTGSGKSSIILSLLKFMHHTGTITIDGINIANVPHQELRQRITTLPQEPIIMEGTVRDNLLPYEGQQGEAGISDSDGLDVLAQVRVREFVEARGGLDGQFAELGLSAGQMQLVAMARAILHCRFVRSRVVLMDEPTSNVDAETEGIIRRLVREAFVGCTVVVISHRADTIENANMLVEMAGGKVVEVTEQEEEEAEGQDV